MSVVARPNRTVQFVYLLLLVLLCLPVYGQTNSAADNARDEDAALRKLASTFYHTLESGNQTSFSELWSSLSPNNELQSFARKHLLWRVSGFEIRLVKIEGNTARVNVHAGLEPLSQPEWPKIPIFLGWRDLQTLRCAKEGATWKVVEQLNTVEDFLRDLVDAPDRAARSQLLAEHPDMISNDLIILLYPGQIDLVSEYDFDKAVDLYRLAIEIETKLGHKKQVADLLNALAIRFGSRGDQKVELEYYLKSLEIREQLPENEQSSATYVYANLGTIYSEQGNYSQALTWFNKSLNPERPQCWIVGNIANTYMNMGEYSKALEYLNKCLASAEKLDPKAGRDGAIAGALAGIGNVHLAQNRPAEGLESYEQALKTIEGSSFSLSPGALQSVLNGIAKTHLQMGNPSRALGFIERALAFPRAQTNAPGADLEILSTAARTYRELGQNDRAREVLNKAIAGSEYRRSHAAGGEQNRQQYFEHLVTPYQEMIKLLMSEKKAEEAFNFAERSKARTLIDVLDSGREEINKYMTTEERRLDMELRRKLATLNVAIQSAKQNSSTDLLRSLETSLEQARLDYESFQTNLYSIHPELRSTRGELRPLTITETANLFHDPRTALLEFVVTDEKTYAFLITKQSGSSPSLRTYSIDITSRDLEQRVSAFREKVTTRDPDFVQSAAELFSLLLGPASREFHDKSSLIIVPDGVLWDLPFQALQSNEKRYLIEDHTIFYAPSFTALKEMSKGTIGRNINSPTSLDLLAVGNPTYGTRVQERIKTGLMDYELEPLPEAERQVASLARLYPATRSKVHIGVAATEARVKAEAPTALVIQFATHGILDSHNPMYSHLVLSQGDNDQDEDGLLEAWEIMKLDLHAELVVLAACETARGRVGAGEGMIGMSWAFFVAGSPTTVASQWKVDSASTTQLMLAFHRNLRVNSSKINMSKAKAFQLAALKLLKTPKYKHPFYWAGFVMIGDGM